jgi:hypothetical protein
MSGSAWLGEFGPDLAAFAASAALVALYYMHLAWRLRRDPTYSSTRVNKLARSLWVARVMGGEGVRDVMAVQTLRNFLMGAMMASTAMRRRPSGWASA